MTFAIRCLVIVSALLHFDSPSRGLEPKEVFILVNKNVPASKEVAEHYCTKRGVPAGNVITLDLPQTEDISRKDYDTRLVAPLREALKEKEEQARVLLSTYGVPLRVGGQDLNEKERAALKELDADLAKAREQVKQLQEAVKALEPKDKAKVTDEVAEQLKSKRQNLDAAQASIRKLEDRRRWVSYAESHASVDSELM